MEFPRRRKKYFWIPELATCEFVLEYINQYNWTRGSIKNPRTVIRCFQGTEALDRIPAGGTLHIVGHSSAKDRRLGGAGIASTQNFTPDALVERLIDLGFSHHPTFRIFRSKSPFFIKLLACQSSLTLEANGGTYAREFAYELSFRQKEGFRNGYVMGYSGDVYLNTLTASKAITPYDSKYPRSHPSHFRVKYHVQGAGRVKHVEGFEYPIYIGHRGTKESDSVLPNQEQKSFNSTSSGDDSWVVPFDEILDDDDENDSSSD